MRKLGSNNKLHTAALCLRVACIALLSALWGCSEQENEVPVTGTDEPMEVSLVIHAKEMTDTRAADTDISLLKSIRVYVFDKAGERVGYYYVNQLQASGSTYYIPLRLSKGGNLTFFVIGNEECVKFYEVIQGQDIGTTVGDPVQLSEETTMTDLYTHCYKTDEADSAAKGYLMTGMTSQIINNRLDAPTVVTCALERDLSELNIAFAKSGNFEVTIDQVTLKDYTTLGWIFGDHPTWERQFADKNLVTNSLTVSDIIASEADQKDASKYGNIDLTSILSYNPNGNYYTENFDWSSPPSTDVKPRLEIIYTQGGTQKTGTVYLPQIGRNVRCNVYCLIKATGISLQLSVKDWVINNTVIEWDNHYEFEFVPQKGTIESDGVSFYPIYYTETTNPEDTDDLLMTFTLKSPLGTEWVASLDNKQDFYFAEADGSEMSGAPKGFSPGAEDEVAQSVTIRLRARNPYDENQPRQVRMAIRVLAPDRNWTRLIINEKQTAGTERDVILIKQVPKS